MFDLTLRFGAIGGSVVVADEEKWKERELKRSNKLANCLNAPSCTVDLGGNWHENERRVPSIKKLDRRERCYRAATVNGAIIPDGSEDIRINFLYCLETITRDRKRLLRASASVYEAHVPFLFSLYQCRFSNIDRLKMVAGGIQTVYSTYLQHSPLDDIISDQSLTMEYCLIKNLAKENPVGKNFSEGKK
ncbi:hypothetical protein LXL04_015482 [Taraxacum kok-saghyz]